MDKIQVLDKSFIPYITAEQIQSRIQELAGAISADFAGKKPLFIAVLNGSFMFAADLFKQVSIPAEICFIKLASYKGTKSTGQVVTAIGLDMDIIDRHVILLEDIVDTGRTLASFLPQLENQQPASLSLAVLLHKPEATVNPVTINYLGFSIPDKFVLGYGLDYDGYGRNLPALYQLAE
jgi:hypoxanthine phosphoribosyltransferase